MKASVAVLICGTVLFLSGCDSGGGLPGVQPPSTTGGPPAGSGGVIAAIPVPTAPRSIAVNTNTGRVYVLRDRSSGDASPHVTVIDVSGHMSTDLLAIHSAQDPSFILANPSTNLIYAGGLAPEDAGDVSVIDGGSNTLTAATFNALSAAALNPVTDRMYIQSGIPSHPQTTDGLGIVDLNSDQQVGTIPLGAYPDAIAVDQQRNRIYAGSPAGISVIDGSSNAVVGSIPLPLLSTFPSARAIAVNPTTNRVYVAANVGNDSISVIDGATNSVIASIPDATDPGVGGKIAINPATNRIYVTTQSGVGVIDGNTNTLNAFFAANPAGFVIGGIDVDPNTNRVFVTDSRNNTVFILAGV